MQFIRDLANFTKPTNGCIATIGNFDGVHLGHQALLERLNVVQQQTNLPGVVILFEPQPQEYFIQDKTKITPRLTRLREKLELLKQFGVQQVLCLRFNQQLASLRSNEFIEQILVQGINLKHLIIGDDFRFGANRAGNYQTLLEYAEQDDYQVEQVASVKIGDLRVSSTAIRQALQAGKLDNAAYLLGRPYTMSGRVVHGDKRGSAVFGAPTANIYTHRVATPVNGVFVVRMHNIPGFKNPVNGVANVGVRPTVDGTRALLEVNLFNFNANIYGQHVKVEFVHKLRDEQRYPSLDALKAAIAKDVLAAKSYFAKQLNNETTS